ncbi:MAG: hypothetical protein VX720_05880 [Pseudomonadota bacterium]|nr:hypothetical protein [Pseudomonadota bacterium]
MADALKKLKALYNPVNRAARKDKRAKKLEDKAEDLAYKHSGRYDTYHAIDDGPVDEKIKAKLDKALRLKKRAAELREKSDDKEWTDEALHGKGGYKLDDEDSPVPYTAPVDSFAIVEEEDSAPIAYRMNGAKFKEQSPNQAFSSKDFHLIQKLQSNYKEPSEGSFKTNAQNIYSSFDSPLGWMVTKADDPEFTNPLQFRAPSELSRRDSGPSRAKYALAAADRITEQNQQGFNNALAGIQAGLTVASAAFGAPGASGWLGKKGG